MIDFDTLVGAVIKAESAGNPNAVSPVGAQGLMQVMPATARDPGFGVQPLANAFDPAENERFGREYLGAMLKRYDGDPEAALAAYNWGPGNADMWVKSGKKVEGLPRETRNYIAGIVKNLDGTQQMQPIGTMPATATPLGRLEPIGSPAGAPQPQLLAAAPQQSGGLLGGLIGSAQAAEMPTAPQAQAPQAAARQEMAAAKPSVPAIRMNLEKMIESGATEQQLDAYLQAQGFSVQQWQAAARDLKSTLDRSRGAPARVREVVGSSPDQDRLANLRRFYPDAIPYGEDNFVFTDPETKRLTLYNPSGLDFGDVPSLMREGAQMVGGAAGAAAGVLAAAPSGFMAAPVSGPIGAGLGTAAGGAMYDAFRNIRGNIDTRDLPQRMTDTAIDAAGGAVGQRVGDLAEAGVRGLVGATRRRLGGDAARLLDDFTAEGVTAPAGAVSGSRAIQSTEKMLENNPASAGRMQDYADNVMTEFRTAVDRTATQFGKRLSPQGAGETIQDAAKSAAGRFRIRQEQLYDDAYNVIGRDTPVQASAVAAYRQSLEQQLAAAPNRARVLKPAIDKAKAIEADAARQGGGLPFEGLRRTRTDIGRDLDNPVIAGSTGAQNDAMRGLYGALTQDMNEAAAANGALAQITKADRYTRFNMGQNIPALQKIADMDAPEKAFRFALQEGKDGATRLSRLRRNFKGEEWNDVAGTVLGRMGVAKPGAQDATGEAFSVSTFMTNWSNLSSEAREALFGGTRYAQLREPLDRLIRIGSALKETDKMANPSGTGRQLAYFAVMSSLGGLAGQAAAGDVQGGAVAGLAGSVVAPRVAAKLITSPRFVNWLAAAPSAMTGANGVSAHIGRLIGIGAMEPALKDAIRSYVDALRAAPPDTGSTAQ